MYSVRTVVGQKLLVSNGAASDITVRDVERAAWTTLEGTFTPDTGYILAVLGLGDASPVRRFALIDAPLSDSVTATVRADVRVLCFSLRKGDVADGFVEWCGSPGSARLLRVSVGAGAATVYVSEDPDEGVQLLPLRGGGFGMRFERERAYDDTSHSDDDGGLGAETNEGPSWHRLARKGAAVRIRITAVGPKWTSEAGQSFYGKLLRIWPLFDSHEGNIHRRGGPARVTWSTAAGPPPARVP